MVFGNKTKPVSILWLFTVLSLQFYLLDFIVFMIYPYLGYPINGLSLYREVNISVFLSSDV